MTDNLSKRLLEKDARLTERFRLKSGNGFLRHLAIFFAHSGDSWFWVLGLALVWLVSKKIWHHNAAILIIGIVFQASLVLAMKFLIKRRRPEGTWGGIYRRTDPHSFPSGHATRAVLLLTMAVGLGPAWFGYALAVWAPLVCVARVVMGVHYLSDVLGGAVLGLFFGWIMLLVSPYIPSLVPFLF
jgi:undecaprenyl-diphosphatase